MKSLCTGVLGSVVLSAFVLQSQATATVEVRDKVVYRFCSQQYCADGAGPEDEPIEINGTLYGTTYEGGASGYGTVFSFDPSTGTETVLHSFSSGADGAYPYAGCST